eukprot:gene14146-11800_t
MDAERAAKLDAREAQLRQAELDAREAQLNAEERRRD